ncbi:hypothetical protein HDE_08981 [Halotydeus destructor]|nr:hypothetical protein HDE_08981 [Halotydeus destructor]
MDSSTKITTTVTSTSSRTVIKTRVTIRSAADQTFKTVIKTYEVPPRAQRPTAFVMNNIQVVDDLLSPGSSVGTPDSAVAMTPSDASETDTPEAE